MHIARIVAAVLGLVNYQPGGRQTNPTVLLRVCRMYTALVDWFGINELHLQKLDHRSIQRGYQRKAQLRYESVLPDAPRLDTQRTCLMLSAWFKFSAASSGFYTTSVPVEFRGSFWQTWQTGAWP